jgi:hypothetical protein
MALRIRRERGCDFLGQTLSEQNKTEQNSLAARLHGVSGGLLRSFCVSARVETGLGQESPRMIRRREGGVMLKAFRIRFGVAMLAMLASALFLVPGRAAADSFTVDATITWSNESSNGEITADIPPSGVATGTFTGSFEFTDNGPFTSSIGAWSFDLSPLGLPNISGTSADFAEFGFFVDGATCGTGANSICDDFDFFDASADDGTELDLETLGDPSDIDHLNGTGCQVCELRFAHAHQGVNVTSVVLTKVATPEPSSLPLLALGLAPLAWFRFRRGLGRLASAA